MAAAGPCNGMMWVSWIRIENWDRRGHDSLDGLRHSSHPPTPAKRPLAHRPSPVKGHAAQEATLESCMLLFISFPASPAVFLQNTSSGIFYPCCRLSRSSLLILSPSFTQLPDGGSEAGNDNACYSNVSRVLARCWALCT